MSNNNRTIVNLKDLQREERKVRARIKNHEIEIAQKFKQLPEEIVTVAVVRLVSTVSSSNIVGNVVGFVEKISNKIFSKSGESGSMKGAVVDGIFSIIKSFLKK